MMNAHTEPHLVSSDTSVLVFVNRVAGRGRVQAYLQRIRDLFEFLHIAAEFLETGSASELESAARQALVRRSEEHTSELQSRLHLVCRLLLEKKKLPHTPRRSVCTNLPSPTTAEPLASTSE